MFGEHIFIRPNRNFHLLPFYVSLEEKRLILFLLLFLVILDSLPMEMKWRANVKYDMALCINSFYETLLYLRL